MKLRFTNFAETTLAQTCAVADTELVVDSATTLPVLASGEKCRVTIYDGENTPEIVEVSAIASATLTVTRAQEGTAARAWGAGAKVRLSLTAEMLESLFSRLEVTYCPTVAGTANAIELTSGENLTSWQTGQIVLFKATATSTDDDVTVSVDGLTPLNLRQLDGTTKPEVGAIVDGLVYMLAIVDSVAILLFPLPQSSAIVGESLKIYGSAELGTLTVLGGAYGESPSSGDDSTRYATTAWVLARLAEISVPEIVNFSTSLTIPNNTAYRSKLADATVNELLKINASNEVVIGGAGTGVIKFYAGGANNFSIATTGVPSHPTPSPGDDSTKSATTAFVQEALTGALSAGFAPLASPEFTGTPRAPTAAGGTNTTQIASTAFVTSAVAPKAPIDSPTFTGTPAAPTAAAGTNTTQVATTAFVKTAVDAGAMPASSITAVSGSSLVLTVDFATYSAYQLTFVNIGNTGGDSSEIRADVSVNGGSSYPTIVGDNRIALGNHVANNFILTVVQPTSTSAGYILGYNAPIQIDPVSLSALSCKTEFALSASINRIRISVSGQNLSAGYVVLTPIAKR